MLIIAGASFALPFLLKKMIGLPDDVYYLVFFLCSVGIFVYYRKSSALRIRASLKSGWALGLVLALFFGLGFVSLSLTGPETFSKIITEIKPIAVLWRGLIYGLAGGLLISVLPFMIAWRALAGPNPAGWRKIVTVLVAVSFMGLSSTAYSLGVSGFRHGSLKQEIAKNFMAGVPTLISGNPLAAPIAGAFMRASEVLKDSGAGSPESKDSMKIVKKPDAERGNN
jgi:hypothetical protein